MWKAGDTLINQREHLLLPDLLLNDLESVILITINEACDMLKVFLDQRGVHLEGRRKNVPCMYIKVGNTIYVLQIYLESIWKT